MERKELLELFKFYKEEKSNPFIGSDAMKAKWWEAEKSLLSAVERDSKTWQRVVSSLTKAIKEDGVSGVLADNGIDINQRAVYFYIDLWNGKNHPYDSLDDIFLYVKG